jgi:hypothetical protein
MHRHVLIAMSGICLFVSSAIAQNSQPTNAPIQPRSWQQVEGLGPHSKILIKSDKLTAVCFVHFVEEDQLTCSRSESIGASSLVFPRNEVKIIKISRGPLGGLVLSATGGVVTYPDELMSGPVVYQR